MTILKHMLPSDLALIVKGEQAKGALMTLDVLRTYVMNQSRLAYGLEQGSAPDITLNLVHGQQVPRPSDQQSPQT